MKWVFVLLVVGLFAYEGYALWTPAEGDTISEMVWASTAAYPVVAFFAGVLCGHFFWPRRVQKALLVALIVLFVGGCAAAARNLPLICVPTQGVLVCDTPDRWDTSPPKPAAKGITV